MENQNDQAFEADQDVNAFESLRPTSSASRRSSHKGKDTMKAAFGAFASQEHEEHENSPLLGRDSDQRQDAGYDSRGAGEHGDAASTWDGERDFEGRPWWNKPSVRTSMCLNYPNLT